MQHRSRRQGVTAGRATSGPSTTIQERAKAGDDPPPESEEQGDDDQPVQHHLGLGVVNQDLVEHGEHHRPEDRTEEGTDAAEGQHDEDPDVDLAEGLIVEGTFGLYLGWVTVATCANITATLVASGVDPEPPWSITAAVVVLAVAASVGVRLAQRLGGRWAVAAAIAWGLGWIAVGRTTDEPRSLVTAIVAVLAALAVVGATARVRRGAGSLNRR